MGWGVLAWRLLKPRLEGSLAHSQIPAASTTGLSGRTPGVSSCSKASGPANKQKPKGSLYLSRKKALSKIQTHAKRALCRRGRGPAGRPLGKSCPSYQRKGPVPRTSEII